VITELTTPMISHATTSVPKACHQCPPTNSQDRPIAWVPRRPSTNLADSLSKGDRVMVTGRLRQRSWETPEGDKRSVAEIEADEVGASLKFATAKLERATERSPSDRNQGRERQAERGGDFNEQPPF
jgi:single-stranded DNA-binding protein